MVLTITSAITAASAHHLFGRRFSHALVHAVISLRAAEPRRAVVPLLALVAVGTRAAGSLEVGGMKRGGEEVSDVN